MQPIYTFFCPVFVTGGTEAIHQASMVFNELGARSQIAYYGQGQELSRVADEVLCLGVGANVCLEAFAAYRPVVASRIALDQRNLIIAPEINALEYQYFQPSRFVVWWLSVDNGLAHNPALADAASRSAFFALPELEHWFQSEYARRFLLASGARSMHRLTDFTDATFTAAMPERPNEGRRILFNRKKGADLAERFFALNPDFEPFALDGMSKAELADAYRHHALYVDFGTLPGKDRMPREAAACGCVVFVRRLGAGAELGDFPLPDDFRFDAQDVETGRLAARIRAIAAQPGDAFAMQSHLRRGVAQEQAAFRCEAQLLLEAHAATSASAPASSPCQPPAAAGIGAAAPAPIAFADGWEACRHRYCLWRVELEDYVHGQAFDEIMQGLADAFTSLGGSAPIITCPSRWSGRLPIVFGAHLLSRDAGHRLPAGSVLFNLEQVDGRSEWLNADYLSLLARHAVLDYSARNTAALAALGIAQVRHLPIGTMPGQHKIAHAAIKDIDVLFYGSLNERRAKVLEGLRARGLEVAHLFGVYGAARDAVIARAKVVLNLHFYEAAIFESVRVSHLLNNGCCVVSEGDFGDPDLAPYDGALAICAYEGLVDTCAGLVGDAPRRAALERAGLALMALRRQSDLLAGYFGEQGMVPAQAVRAVA